jgi:hypothetical protein
VARRPRSARQPLQPPPPPDHRHRRRRLRRGRRRPVALHVPSPRPGPSSGRKKLRSDLTASSVAVQSGADSRQTVTRRQLAEGGLSLIRCIILTDTLRCFRCYGSLSDTGDTRRQTTRRTNAREPLDTAHTRHTTGARASRYVARTSVLLRYSSRPEWRRNARFAHARAHVGSGRVRARAAPIFSRMLTW